MPIHLKDVFDSNEYSWFYRNRDQSGGRKSETSEYAFLSSLTLEFLRYLNFHSHLGLLHMADLYQFSYFSIHPP